MANHPWTVHDYLVLIKGYIQAEHRHMEEEIDEDFWVNVNDAYNNHPECKTRRRNLDTRSIFVTFTRACHRYRKIITEVERENVFQNTRSTFNSLYFMDYQTHFVGHAAYDLSLTYIRQFE